MKKQFESVITKEVRIRVYCNDYGQIVAYTDGEMEDGFDYEEYESRLAAGELFDTIAQEIVDALVAYI